MRAPATGIYCVPFVAVTCSVCNPAPIILLELFAGREDAGGVAPSCAFGSVGPVEYQSLLVQQLGHIDRVVQAVARRHQLTVADAEELTSVVRFKLIDKDFAILRKFEGRSAITTYLTVVVARLCLDFFNERWGKWRPSAVARRLGGSAILLEQLVDRVSRSMKRFTRCRSITALPTRVNLCSRSSFNSPLVS
jgi:hypothetical protein